MTIDVSGAVLAGYDGSEQSKAAVDWAAAEARRRDTDLVVLHAVRRPELAVPEDERSTGREGAADEIAKDGADRARGQAPELQVRALTQRKGAAAAMQELSRDAALIVVGNRGRGRLGEGLVGSVAYATSAHAQCPVVIVRGRSAHLPGPGRPVVVGTDGSDSAAEAVARAAELAAETGAKLVIATAWQRPDLTPWTPGYMANVHAGEEAAQTAEQSARDIVIRAQQHIHARHPDLEIESGTQEGRPEHVLAELSVGAGLLVVGSRGHSDLAGLLLGSVSRAAMHSAHCPVAVVR